MEKACQTISYIDSSMMRLCLEQYYCTPGGGLEYISDLVFSMKSFAGAVMSFVTVIPPPVPPTLEVKSAVLPNGHLMTPHDQRRRAALLADSPELSTRPPLNAGNLGKELCNF